MRVLKMAVLVSLAALAAPGPTRAQAPPAADLVLINGTILTVDASDSVAQAVAIAGGKIVAVGSTDADQGAHRRRRREVIDLRGRTATPGLIDTHVHFSEADALFSVDLSDGARRSPTCWRGCATQVAKLEAGRMGARPRMGRGQVRRAPLHHRRRPRQGRAEQSRVADAHDRPLRRREQLRAEAGGGHGSDHRDPPAGTIDRDAQGNADRRDEGIGDGLVSRHVPPLTREQQQRRHRPRSSRTSTRKA